jgi:hypothetical protein
MPLLTSSWIPKPTSAESLCVESAIAIRTRGNPTSERRMPLSYTLVVITV